MSRTEPNTTYQALLAECDRAQSVGGVLLRSHLADAVAEEMRDHEHHWRQQVPRRAYTDSQRNRDHDRAKDEVAAYVAADRTGKVVDDKMPLPDALTAEHVFMYRKGRLLAWAVAQKLRGR